MLEPTSNVVAFRRRAAAIPQRHPKTLMEAVYSAGSLAIAAEETALKSAAAMLHALGFLEVEEILADGTARRLPRGRTRGALDRPWRLSKPAVSGESGLPDAGGAFAR
jgi:hypothetical protein